MRILIYLTNVVILSYFPLRKALTTNSHVLHLVFAALQSIVTDLRLEWQNGSDYSSLQRLKL